MAAPIPNIVHGNHLARRSIAIGAAGWLICVPAIVQVANLMPARRLPFPFELQYAGYVHRHTFMRSGAACERFCEQVEPTSSFPVKQFQ